MIIGNQELLPGLPDQLITDITGQGLFWVLRILRASSWQGGVVSFLRWKLDSAFDFHREWAPGSFQKRLEGLLQLHMK
jgi:hypothetical protein